MDNALILAQGMGAFSLLHWCVIVIVVAAAVGIVLAVCKHFGVAIPPIFVTIFWIVLVAIVAVVAIKILIGFI